MIILIIRENTILINPFYKIKLLIVSLVAILVTSVWIFYKTLFSTINLNDKPIFFEIEYGENFSQTSEKLKMQGIIDGDILLKIYARISAKGTKIQAGEYMLDGTTNLFSIINKFVLGDIHLHPFTIIEGWTANQMIENLTASNLFSGKNESPFAINSGFLEANENIEGLFLPETYLFPKATSINSVLYSAHDALIEVLQEEWLNRANNLPIKTPYEGLILASIIEKETAVPDERSRIASVFIQRLKLKMRLQTDPTVIYGLGDKYDGDITRSDLRSDTPYNTYTRNGLPPTPIALAGRDSIHAAFNPADEKNIYFVATGDKDGRHKFSTNKNDHDLAVKDYLDKTSNKAN